MSAPRPARVELLDPVDRWLHGAAVAGFLGALATGPALEVPAAAGRLGVGSGAVAAVHAASGAVAAFAWAFHLVRVCLAWLEGGNPSGLLPRPSDLAELARTVAWTVGLGRRPPEPGRFSYRERFPYGFFLAAVPLLVLTGWATAHPARAFGVLGADGLVTAAAVHAAVGLWAVLAVLWHLYFAHLRPAVLFWNPVWLTGSARFETVERTRPAWARELLGELAPESGAPEAEVPSVEELLRAGNQAARDGRYDEAAVAYREALGLYPGYGQALFNLGIVRWRAGDAAGAVEALERFLEQDPFGPNAAQAKDLVARIRGEGPGG